MSSGCDSKLLSDNRQSVLEVKDLKTHLFTKLGVVKAVDGVSLRICAGETLGLVGESGCGKTLTALSILRLPPKPAGKIVGGEILLDGEDLCRKTEKEMSKIRGRRISMILQDATSSLNPIFSIGFQIEETIRQHQRLTGKDLRRTSIDALRAVEISSPETRLRNYPHELSGGMRQRVSGAIAMACQPEVIIADEPTTSLDVTIQAQYLQLLKDIQRRTGVCLMFITHDFGVVAQVCDNIAVMYAGKIVESGSVMQIFDRPCHPYTKALLAAVPSMQGNIERLAYIQGEPPQLYNLPTGCYFHPRCPQANAQCRKDYPPVTSVSPGHLTSCWQVN